jgi:hypothetical protein
MKCAADGDWNSMFSNALNTVNGVVDEYKIDIG